MHAQKLDHAQLFATPWTLACQASLSMGFSKQEFLSGLPFPPPEDLPDPGIEPVSPTSAGRFFTTEPPEKPIALTMWVTNSLNVSCQWLQEVDTSIRPFFIETEKLKHLPKVTELCVTEAGFSLNRY